MMMLVRVLTMKFGNGPVTKCLLLLLILQMFAAIRARNAEKELLKKLVEMYHSPSARPVKNHKEPVEIKVKISLIDVIKLDEAFGCATFKLWMTTAWKDEFLIWNLSHHDVKRINIATNQPPFAWLPDVYLFNSLESVPSEPKFPDAICYHTGDVYWVRPMVVTLPVRYQFKANAWIGGLKLGSWTYGSNSIDLQPLGAEGSRAKASFVDGGLFSGSDRWELLETTGHRKVTVLGCCEEPRVSVHALVRFKKKTRIN